MGLVPSLRRSGGGLVCQPPAGVRRGTEVSVGDTSQGRRQTRWHQGCAVRVSGTAGSLIVRTPGGRCPQSALPVGGKACRPTCSSLVSVCVVESGSRLPDPSQASGGSTGGAHWGDPSLGQEFSWTDVLGFHVYSRLLLCQLE